MSQVSQVALGQNLSIGVVGGISLGDDVQTRLPAPLPVGTGITRSSGSTGYLIGPPIEFRIKSAFSLEVDGLYRALHFTDLPGSVVTWQFPMLAKGGQCRYSRRLRVFAPSTGSLSSLVCGDAGCRRDRSHGPRFQLCFRAAAKSEWDCQLPDGATGGSGPRR